MPISHPEPVGHWTIYEPHNKLPLFELGYCQLFMVNLLVVCGSTDLLNEPASFQHISEPVGSVLVISNDQPFFAYPVSLWLTMTNHYSRHSYKIVFYHYRYNHYQPWIDYFTSHSITLQSFTQEFHLRVNQPFLTISRFTRHCITIGIITQEFHK